MKMGEVYFRLKKKLEELGYNDTLPIDAVPLVECIVADLLQTTRSLQHYMDISKEALIQRDTLMLEAEPYKCENSKLIQENNMLHKEVIKLKEETAKISKDNTRKIKSMSEELSKKDTLISKLKHDVRDLSLRGLCAGTSSSRNKSRKSDLHDHAQKVCLCKDNQFLDQKDDIIELKKQIELLQNQNYTYHDEILLLKNQVEHRDSEIVRLNIMLEGGRPLTTVSKDCCSINSDNKIQDLLKKLQDLESTNDFQRKELESGLEKQHEAMLRALNLADKNTKLQEELHKVDTLALKVEDDCNKRLSAMVTDINLLQQKIQELTKKNFELEKLHLNQVSSSNFSIKLQEDLNLALKEKDTLQKEISDLIDINKNLQDKIMSLSQVSLQYPKDKYIGGEGDITRNKCLTKHELQILLEDERKKYESYITNIQEKLNETISLFNNDLKHCKKKSVSSYSPYGANENRIMKDLQNKLCESDQTILMLKKENDDLKLRINNYQDGCNKNYKDIITQLNTENSELSRDNITLSQQLSHYKNIYSSEYKDRGDYNRHDIEKLNKQIEKLTNENQLLKKDKQEYNFKYKDAAEQVEKFKRELILKQRDLEKLEEENCSYKMSNRTDRASAGHLKDECNFLREQLKKIQNEFIKEKTLASQIKNIQLETERSTAEIQNDLLSVQKKLSLAKDTIESLKHRNKDLQSEIISLKKDKINLIENIKQIDQERDKLVLELDHKSESINLSNQKLKSQSFEITKLESEICELKRQINVNKVFEHKVADNDTQIKFLNGEISRLSHQLDNALIENKQIQNSLGDSNGALRLLKIEYEKSRKEVESLKQQLQHYVEEIRRIEEMLSHKDAERSDMLEQFASLSVEANILENTNHSLESEAASKSVQIQSYVNKIQSLEGQLIDKEAVIEKQSSKIATMTCRISALENEVKLLTEEKTILDQNVSYLKHMCSDLQKEHANISKDINDTDSELRLYENRIKSLSSAKTKLERERDQLQNNLATTESLLSNARKEIVELKLALQDATSETKSLQDRVGRLSRLESEVHESTMTKDDIDLPLLLEETIHEVSQEDDEDSSRYHEVHKRFSKYSHGSTL